jgi:alpha-methylacyl-CoA racemase
VGPLTSLRVIEFAGIGPAPFCGMLLADLGADVVRIDRPGGGAGVTLPAEADFLGRGKRAVTLDLKDPAAVSAALELVSRADALVEGYRPGVMERLGLGPSVCLARRPALVYGRMTGWGQDGPLAARAGHDINYLALSGVLHAIGRRGGPPAPPLNVVGDFGGGALYLAMGVLAAVLHARGTGRGQVVDAAIVDGTASLATVCYAMLAAGYWRDVRGGNLLDGGCPWYDVYETADGRHVAVGAIEAPFYARLLAVLGLDAVSLPDQWDVGRWAELRTAFARRIRTRTRDEWAEAAAGEDACLTPVLGLTEAPGHVHLRARGTFLEPDTRPQPAAAPRFSGTPARAGRPVPPPAATVEDVIAGWPLGPDRDRL